MVHFCAHHLTLIVFYAANGYDEFSEIMSLKNETEKKKKKRRNFSSINFFPRISGRNL